MPRGGKKKAGAKTHTITHKRLPLPVPTLNETPRASVRLHAQEHQRALEALANALNTYEDARNAFNETVHIYEAVQNVTAAVGMYAGNELAPRPGAERYGSAGTMVKTADALYTMSIANAIENNIKLIMFAMKVVDASLDGLHVKHAITDELYHAVHAFTYLNTYNQVASIDRVAIMDEAFDERYKPPVYLGGHLIYTDERGMYGPFHYIKTRVGLSPACENTHTI